MLDCLDNTAWLFDRGGTRRIAQFDGLVSLEWERVLNNVSSATVVVDVAQCGCDWLAQVRALRHELVIFRGSERVWEGPITRVEYAPNTVTIDAKDVLSWLTRRVMRRRFNTGTNVGEAFQIIKDAFTYDDPNIVPWIDPRATGQTEYISAWNRAETTYYDALADIGDDSLNYTAIGRRIVLWPSTKKIGQTAILRSPEDLQQTVTVIEDGISLATRVVVAGNDTFGAAGNHGSDMDANDKHTMVVPEPQVVNWASNPSLEAGLLYWQAEITTGTYAAGFDLSRKQGTWGDGNWYGQINAHPPAKVPDQPKQPKAPTMGKKGNSTDAEWQRRLDAYHQARDAYEKQKKAWDKTRGDRNKEVQKYNKALSDYNNAEVMLNTYGQRLPVHEGELISAILSVRGIGGRNGKIALRWHGVKPDGEIVDDRSFAEGDMKSLSTTTTKVLSVVGTVPEDVAWAFIEVVRDTQVEWNTAANGFIFDQFAIFQGRIENWFDGNTADVASHTYKWRGAANNSVSDHYWANDVPGEYRDRMSTYYGIVELLEDTHSETRAQMEREALTEAKKTYPAPLVVDVPADAPLLPSAPVQMSELVAGTTVQIQTLSTCRQVRAACTLDRVGVTQDSDGERVTITLTSGQVWELDDPVAIDSVPGVFHPPATPHEVGADEP